jgi:phage FluMu protein Com
MTAVSGLCWGDPASCDRILPEYAEPETHMSGKCPKCQVVANVLVESIRARDEGAEKTLPAVQFLCSECRTILGVSLDPDWQAQIVAGQLRTVGISPGTSH